MWNTERSVLNSKIIENKCNTSSVDTGVDEGVKSGRVNIVKHQPGCLAKRDDWRMGRDDWP